MPRPIPLLALASALALPALRAAPAAAAEPAAPIAPGQEFAPSVRARIWLEDERDSFRRGERLRVRFSASDDSYVAVIHIDPDGNLDFLYPSSPWDDGFVRRGRVYSPDRAGGTTGWPVRGGAGIGYLYLIASPVPLDYSYFHGGRGSGWDWSFAGRSVHGDPFWAMEQITRHLLPGWGAVPYATDYAHYYVEGRHRYPSYACGDGYGYGRGGGWGWYDGYSSCDRLSLFLRDNPYYYDTRLYRGDRRARFRDYDYRVEDRAPRHGYKERVGTTRPDSRVPLRNYDDDESPRRATVGVPREAGRQRPSEPSRRRPSLERRSGEGSPAPKAQPSRAPSRGGAARGNVPRQSSPKTSPSRPRPKPTKGSGS